jgi:outer membrane protein assembly factor BamB
VSFAVAQCVSWLVLPRLFPEQGFYWFLATLLLALAIIGWWAFASRAARLERWGGLALIVLALYAVSRGLHVSVAQAGMGMLYFFLAIPWLSLALLVAVVATRRLPDARRRLALAAVILLATGAWLLVRVEGIRGEGGMDAAWRWSKTAEERLLGEVARESAGASPTIPAGPPEWPGFRGAGRDGVVRSLRIETDWSASPPEQLWRRAVGPAWSSFAVAGGRLYTQEQRGDEEVVSCYAAASGKPLWHHADATRFWEANAGPGPRGTPTVHDGRVYALGATGILNALDAASGDVVWSRNVASDAEVEVPYWGFASSPLVVDDLVVDAAAGRLAAYDVDDGAPRWLGPERAGGYSSPHRLTVGGLDQIVLLNGTGATSVAVPDGTILWEHAWAGAAMLQPAVTLDGDLLVTTSDMSGGTGLRRITVGSDGGAWHVQERWTSTGLKPYFNDFVVHDGHAYGFDGSMLACIDLRDGARQWKGGRYGHGQLLLLSEADALLVLSERGELALVAAVPDGFTEIARVPAIEGKTWNHPAIAGDVLLVRNDREMVAFRLRRLST